MTLKKCHYDTYIRNSPSLDFDVIKFLTDILPGCEVGDYFFYEEGCKLISISKKIEIERGYNYGKAQVRNV